MYLVLPSRRTGFIVVGVLLALALWFGLPFLSPGKGVIRSWDAVLRAVEDHDAEALGRLLGADYTDGFGLDRAAAIELAGRIHAHFVVCTLRRERSELILDPSGKSAVTRALVRLGGQGSPVAQGAMRASQTSETPTAFRWRRNSWKPWDWRLVAVDNPDAARALARFQREAGQLGFSP